MRDIGSRIGRYRLSRYGSQSHGSRLLLPVWIVIAAWSVWALVFSNHSFYKLWRLQHTSADAKQELARTQRELAGLEAGLEDPSAVRELAEHTLREKTGMAKPGEIIYRIKSSNADSVGAR